MIIEPVLSMWIDHRDNMIQEQRIIHADIDLEPVGRDNICSAYILHRIECFIGQPMESKRTIKGFGGTKEHNIMKDIIK